MKFNLPKALLFRFIEIFLSCAVFSAIITELNQLGVLSVRSYLTVSLTIAVTLFFIFAFFSQRRFYIAAQGNMLYYLASVIPYAVFAGLGAILYITNYRVFVWLFLITKSFNYITYISFSERVSILIFHIIGFLVILLSTVGMKSILMNIKSVSIIDEEEDDMNRADDDIIYKEIEIDENMMFDDFTLDDDDDDVIIM